MSVESPSLGERIRALRLERKLSMRALAEAAGIKSVAFVADVEKGFRNPSAEVLAGLARALNQPLDALRRYDSRPPVVELRAMTARDAGWALALRKLADAALARRVTPDDLMQFLEKQPRATSRSATRRVAAVPDTPALFDA